MPIDNGVFQDSCYLVDVNNREVYLFAAKALTMWIALFLDCLSKEPLTVLPSMAITSPFVDT